MPHADEPRHGHYIRTYTGRKFWPTDPRAEDVHIEDIAHALALCNRFAGHTRLPYSVAQHSVMMARTFEHGSLERKSALMHDAAEAFIGDMVRPLKRHEQMQPFRDVEDRVMAAICERFGLLPAWVELTHVVEADQAMLRSEQRDLVRSAEGWRNAACLYPEGAVQPWPWWQAEIEFLLEFELLWPDWAFERPESPHALLQVSGDDMLRLLQENAILLRLANRVPSAARNPYDPAEEWDEVAAEIKRVRGERVRP